MQQSNIDDNIDDNNTLSGESIVWECVINEVTKLHVCSMETKQEKHQSISNEVAIPDIITEISNQRIHTDTLSGERAVCECFLHHLKSLRISWKCV